MPGDIARRARAAAAAAAAAASAAESSDGGSTVRSKSGWLKQSAKKKLYAKNKITIYLHLSNVKASSTFCEVEIQVSNDSVMVIGCECATSAGLIRRLMTIITG